MFTKTKIIKDLNDMWRNLAITKRKHIFKVFISATVCCLIIIYTPIINQLQKNTRNVSNRKKSRGQEESGQVKIHIVTQVPVIINGSQSKRVHQRQEEYIETLKLNLQHPQVDRIHVLLERHEDIQFLEHSIKYSEKINYHPLNRRMLYGDAFRYVSEFLLHKTIIIMNADCYIGNGFQKLDTNILRKGTVYALTRHETPKAIRNCKAKDLCGAQAKYIGSHDAFVLNLVKPLHSNVLNTLMVRQNIVGVEKFVIYTLRTLGKFIVKNPCNVLVIFHNHCTNLRYKQERLIRGKRLNVLYLKNIPLWTMSAPFSTL